MDVPEGASIQIQAGLGDSDSDDTLGDEISHVCGYDISNQYLGQSGSATMAGNGDYITLVIDQNVPGVEDEYIAVANGDDATCIAWISVKQFDSSPAGAWTGDVGFNCGQNWFHGNQRAGTLPDGSDYMPGCTWLDGNHDNNISAAL